MPGRTNLGGRKLAAYQKDFLINEYNCLMSMMSTSCTIAYSVLSGVTVIYGYFLTRIWEDFSFKKPLEEPLDLFLFMLTILPTIAALLLGQFTSGAYIFHFRLMQIAKRFGVEDLWSHWDRYIRGIHRMNLISGRGSRVFLSFPQHAGSSPLAIVLGGGALIAFVTICLVAIPQRADEGFWIRNGFWVILSLPIAIFNFFLIYRIMNPIYIYKDIFDRMIFEDELLPDQQNVRAIEAWCVSSEVPPWSSCDSYSIRPVRLMMHSSNRGRRPSP